MAKTDTFHIRVEPKVKKKAEETLNELGLSITEAINVFLTTLLLGEALSDILEYSFFVIFIKNTSFLIL